MYIELFIRQTNLFLHSPYNKRNLELLIAAQKRYVYNNNKHTLLTR